MTAPASRPSSIYLVAGEESGDALGGALIRALRQRSASELDLAGVGGHAMAAAGVASLFAFEELSINGISAIPRRLPAILRRIRQTADAIIAKNPDVLVIIDSPDFTHRVARRVRRQRPSIPIIDYVSPSVWAWRSGRARTMRAYVDHVLAILPFEPAAHERLGGPPCTYVGHPLIERLSDLRPNPDEALRRRDDPPLVLLLPGSRTTEVRRLSAVFGAALERVADRVGPMELVLPTLPHLSEALQTVSSTWAVKPRIVTMPADKWGAFRSARAALAASGTVTLELALAGVPTVAAYRISTLEEVLARLIRLNAHLSSVILANLVLGANIMPEFIQHQCTPDRLAQALEPLLSDTPERRSQVEAFARLDGIMGVGDEAPSAKAAAIVLDFAQRGRR
jgi:lipid-A-disaccharide synthase